MIPITKPSLDNSDYKHIKKVLKSKILTDGYFQQKTEILLKKSRFTADGEIMLSNNNGLSFIKFSLIALNFLKIKFLNLIILFVLMENPPAIL